MAALTVGPRPVFVTNGWAVSDGQTNTLGRDSTATRSTTRQVVLSVVGHSTSASVLPIVLKRLSCSRYGKKETKALAPLRLTLVSDTPAGGAAQSLGPDPSQPKRPAGKKLFASWKVCAARPICLRLFWHFMRAAASRTFCTAGSRRPMRIAMIAMTTSNSIRVNAARPRIAVDRDIESTPGEKENVRIVVNRCGLRVNIVHPSGSFQAHIHLSLSTRFFEPNNQAHRPGRDTHSLHEQPVSSASQIT